MRLKSVILLYVFSLFSYAIFAQDFTTVGNWPRPEYSRAYVAMSIDEALQRPSTIRQLYLWDYTEEEAAQIPKLKNLEVLIFGYSDMDYYCKAYEFPVEFCRLKHLKKITIINALTPFPDSIGTIQSLKILQTGMQLPESISLLDSLTELYAPLPAEPWPGNFKSLKIHQGSGTLKQICKLKSLEEGYWGISNDSIRNDSMLACMIELKNLKKISIGGFKELEHKHIIQLFQALDQLPRLEELHLFRFFVRGEPSVYYSSKALLRIKKLRLNGLPDLRAVLPAKLEHLKFLEIKDGNSYKPDFSMNDMIQHFPPLQRLSAFVQIADTSWLNHIMSDPAQDQFEIFEIVTEEQFQERYYLTSDDKYYIEEANYSDRLEPIYLLRFLTRQKNLMRLNISGFWMNELESLVKILHDKNSISSICLELMAKDGKPFPKNLLNEEQQKNWVLLRDDIASYEANGWQIRKPEDPIAWKLISAEHGFLSYEKSDPNTFFYNPKSKKTEVKQPRIGTQFSAVPIHSFANDSFPAAIRLTGENPDTRLSNMPCILLADSSASDGYTYYTNLINYIITNEIQIALNEKQFLTIGVWTCNIYENILIDFSEKERLSHRKIINIPNGTIELEWYSTGALSHCKYGDEDEFIEINWSETGTILYFKDSHRWAKHINYFEVEMNENGNLLWLRGYNFGKYYELRFAPGNYLSSEGWLDNDFKPTGTWYYFDETGNCTSGKAPKKLKTKN